MIFHRKPRLRKIQFLSKSRSEASRFAENDSRANILRKHDLSRRLRPYLSAPSQREKIYVYKKCKLHVKMTLLVSENIMSLVYFFIFMNKAFVNAVSISKI